MPTYEFRCPQGHEFEKFYRSIGGAEAQAACPECGLPAERQMSATSFAFKGPGFYLTDYGKNAHRDKGTPEQKNGAAPAESGGGDSDKGEARSDAPSAPTPAAAQADKKPSGDAAAEPKKKKSDSKAAEPKPAPAPRKKSAGE
jgi:putative FmdB family regulatory protein